jgi:hypothetical protein
MRPPGRRDSPAGTRTRSELPSRRGVAPLIAILTACALFSVAIGDETATLTVTNLTPHPLDMVIAGRTYDAVAPGAAVMWSASRATLVQVKVAYPPGQALDGAAERFFYVAPYHAAYVAGSGGGFYFACSTGGSITHPATGGPVQWGVTSDTLATANGTSEVE